MRKRRSPEKPTTSDCAQRLTLVPDRGLTADGFERETHHAREGALDCWRGRALHAPREPAEPLTPGAHALGGGLASAHAGVPEGAEAARPEARCSPSALERTALTRLSKRASIWETSLRTTQPPRASVGSSMRLQARSSEGAASRSRTTAASSGCRCTRTSR